MPLLIKLKVVASQLGDVHQAFHIHGIQRDKNAKTGHRCHRASKLFTQVIAHVLALEPGLHVATGLISTALVGTAMQARSFPALYFSLRHTTTGLDLRISHTARQTLGHLLLRLPRRRQLRQLVLGFFQNGFDDAVHQQIRIAPDRAGEVRVRLKRQTKVPTVIGRVHGLHHGAQQHGVNLLRIGAILGGRRNRLKLCWTRCIADRQRNTQGFQVSTQQLQLFNGRLVMHPKQCIAAILFNEICTANVGRQHALFNQTVCVIARARNDFLDAAIVITNNLRLHRIEIHRTTRLPRLQQGAKHTMQVQQVWHALRPLLRLRATGVRQNCRHLGICKTRMAVHDTRVKLIGMHLTLGRDQHVADHAQAIDIRVQRAQAVGQLFRQHGNHTTREIHTGCTLISVNVNGIAVLHVVTDISNRHQQAPALAAPYFGRLAIHRIIKVAGIFAVDGAQRHIAQIHAPLAIFSHHLFGQRLCSIQTCIRKNVRHTVLAHRNFNFHARVIHFTQHFHNAPDRLTKQGRRLCQLHHNHLPGLGFANRALRHQDILAVTLVFRRNQPHATFLQQTANQRFGGALNNFDNMPLRATTPVLSHDVHAHTIFVQHGTHLIGRKENIGTSIVTNDKAMPISVPLHNSFNLLERSACVGARVHFFAIQSKSFLKSPGGGIGRRTSFRY